VSELLFALGLPTVSGRIRTTPEDFQVVENLGFTPTGEGEHVFLRVRKRDANTAWVAGRLAVFAGVAPVAVGYAGLKDRHAVTEQWFSVQLPGRGEPDWAACGDDSFSVLESVRHNRKLKRGALQGNAFRIVIRELQGDPAVLAERLQDLARLGVPNYFGEQRFGRGGDNVAQAEAMFAGELRVKDRQRRGMYLSAARSAIFNRLLARRVQEQTWNRALPGDVMMLSGSHSVFAAPVVNDDLCRRMAALDIHPTGPLWGKGALLSQEEVLALEQAIAEKMPTLCQGLEQAGLKQERRALRVAITNVTVEMLAPQSAVVAFHLPAGAYATVVLRELVGLGE